MRNRTGSWDIPMMTVCTKPREARNCNTHKTSWHTHESGPRMQNGVAFATDATECARRTQGQCAACFPRTLGAWPSGHLGEDTGLWPDFWGMPDGLHRFFSYWGIPCRTRMLMAALVRSCCRSRAATVLAAFLIAFLFAAAMRAAVASTWKMSDASVSFLSRAASTAPTSAHAAISSPVNCSAFSRCSVVYGPMVPVIAALLGPTSPPLHGGDGSSILKPRSIPGRLSSKALRSRSIWAAGRDGSRRGEALGARGDVGVIGCGHDRTTPRTTIVTLSEGRTSSGQLKYALCYAQRQFS